MKHKFILAFGILSALIALKPAFSCYRVDDFLISFHGQACFKPYKAYVYKICDNITVNINHKKSIYIPVDFETDLATIPQCLWPILAPTHSLIISPSILHDYLYTCPSGFNRRQVDMIFYNALVKNGLSPLRAYEMYLAVRMFGGSHFAKGPASFICKKYATH